MKHILLFAVFLTALASVSASGNLYQKINRADVLAADGEYKAALQLLAPELENEPQHALLHNRVAYCYLNLGEYGRALQHYRRSNNISSSINSQAGIQWALLLQKNYRQSIEAGQTALQTDSNNYHVRIRLAYANYALKRYEQARRQYLSVADSFHDDPDALWGAGLSSLSIGQRSAAMNDFYRGYRSNPDHQGIRRSLGLPPVIPYGVFLPRFAFFSFHDTSLKEDGVSFGGRAYMAFNDDFSAGAAYMQTRGYHSSNPDSLQYMINDTSAIISYRFNRGLAASTSAHYLFGDDSYTDGAFMVSSSLAFIDTVTFSVELGGLFYPGHTGVQAVPGLAYPIYGVFKGRTSLYGQVISFSDDTVTSSAQSSPMVNASVSAAGMPRAGGNSSFNQTGGAGGSIFSDFDYYGAVEQTLYFEFSRVRFGTVLRYGSLFTPLFSAGETAVFNTETLTAGISGFFDYYPVDRLMVQLSYSYDRWENIFGETPYSHQFQAAVTVRLP